MRGYCPSRKTRESTCFPAFLFSGKRPQTPTNVGGGTDFGPEGVQVIWCTGSARFSSDREGSVGASAQCCPGRRSSCLRLESQAHWPNRFGPMPTGSAKASPMPVQGEMVASSFGPVTALRFHRYAPEAESEGMADKPPRGWRSFWEPMIVGRVDDASLDEQTKT